MKSGTQANPGAPSHCCQKQVTRPWRHWHRSQGCDVLIWNVAGINWNLAGLNFNWLLLKPHLLRVSEVLINQCTIINSPFLHFRRRIRWNDTLPDVWWFSLPDRRHLWPPRCPCCGRLSRSWWPGWEVGRRSEWNVALRRSRHTALNLIQKQICWRVPKWLS